MTASVFVGLSMAYWSVARTQSFCERKAGRFLASKGYEYYLPFFQKIFFFRQEKKRTVLPLFSRYIFVRIENGWYDIKSTIGISSLIFDEEKKPAVIPDKIIFDLRKREDRNGFIKLPKKEEFHIGQSVKIVGGKFSGRIGLYDGMNTRQRERVLLELLGQIVPVELNKIDSHVEAVPVAVLH
jgi:transcriptional antiterminator RfaH